MPGEAWLICPRRGLPVLQKSDLSPVYWIVVTSSGSQGPFKNPDAQTTPIPIKSKPLGVGVGPRISIFFIRLFYRKIERKVIYPCTISHTSLPPCTTAGLHRPLERGICQNWWATQTCHHPPKPGVDVRVHAGCCASCGLGPLCDGMCLPLEYHRVSSVGSVGIRNFKSLQVLPGCSGVRTVVLCYHPGMYLLSWVLSAFLTCMWKLPLPLWHVQFPCKSLSKAFS